MKSLDVGEETKEHYSNEYEKEGRIRILTESFEENIDFEDEAMIRQNSIIKNIPKGSKICVGLKEIEKSPSKKTKEDENDKCNI